MDYNTKLRAELSRCKDEELYKLRSELEIKLCELDWEYLRNDEESDRTGRDRYIDKGYFLDNIRLVDFELRRRGIYDEWMKH